MNAAVATKRGSRLVDLLIARGGVDQAHLDGGSTVLEAEVSAIPIEAVEAVVVEEVVAVLVEVVEVPVLTELGDTYLVLGIAGVARLLDTHTLVRVE
jgi:hypothetical protein